MNLKGRHFLTLKDFSPEEILSFLDLSAGTVCRSEEEKERRSSDRHAAREKCSTDFRKDQYQNPLFF